MSTQTSTERRYFGAGDTPSCTTCGQRMHIIRRSPNTTNLREEVQTFACGDCQEEMTRTVDTLGNPRT
jgi:predicted SprT family Zn-dependent metalloprotease